MEVLLKSNSSLLAEKVVELEEKVKFILDFLRIPATTDFKKNFERAPSSSPVNTKEPRDPYPRAVKLRTGHSQELSSQPQPEVGQEWVGGGKGGFQCQICGIRYPTKLKLDYHKMKLKHRGSRNQPKNEVLLETDNFNNGSVQNEDQEDNDDLNDNENFPTSSPPPSPLDADTDYLPENNSGDQSESEQKELPKKIKRRKREVENEEESENGEKGKFKCLVCGMRFLTRKKCESHKANKKHRIRKNQKGKATCEHCGKVIVYGKLKTHLLRHSEERGYLCNLCGKALKSEATLTTHIKMVHEVEGKNFQCKYCQSWHRSEQSLRTHYAIHQGKMDEMCPHCGKIYANLKRHIIEVHEKVRAFECNLCPQRFKKKSHLDRHLGSHAKGDQRRVKSYHKERPEVYARRKCEKKVARFKGVGGGEGENSGIDVVAGDHLGVSGDPDNGGQIASEGVGHTADEGMDIGIGKAEDVQNDN